MPMLISSIRQNPTLDTHLHVLAKLLAMKDPSDKNQERNPMTPTDHLLRYVIATCYRKMLHRATHPKLSMPYIESLRKVDVTEIRFREQKPPSDEDIHRDQRFLSFVLQLFGFGNKFPTIASQAELLRKGEPFQLYSNNTYKEFHELLLFYLQGFSESLDELSVARKTAVTLQDFKDPLERVVVNGYVLQKLSKTFALETHLQIIELSLREHRRAANVAASMSNSVKGEEQCGDREDNDEELEAVQPSVTIQPSTVIPLWRSYRNWLRLMVVHFDAVHILSRYFQTGPNSQHQPLISLRILVAPPVDRALFPWRQLLDSTHFPTESYRNLRITNGQILDFLKNAVTTTETVKSVMKIWTNQLRQNQASKTRIDAEVQKLTASKLPGWSASAEELAKMLNKWKPGEVSIGKEITDMIQSLHDSVILFEGFERTTFSGTLHCEACLASVLNQDFVDIKIRNKYQDILQHTKVGDAVPAFFVLFYIT
jgi:hypothetical protein